MRALLLLALCLKLSLLAAAPARAQADDDYFPPSYSSPTRKPTKKVSGSNAPTVTASPNTALTLNPTPGPTKPPTPQSLSISIPGVTTPLVVVIDASDPTLVRFTATAPGQVWIGISPYRRMVGAIAIIGMDLASNPGHPNVGLYHLGGINGPQDQTLLNGTLASLGIMSSSFSMTSTSSVLTFSLSPSLAERAGFSIVGSQIYSMFAIGFSAMFMTHQGYSVLPVTYIPATLAPTFTARPVVPPSLAPLLAGAPTRYPTPATPRPTPGVSSTLARWSSAIGVGTITVDSNLTLSSVDIVVSYTSNAWLGFALGSIMIGSRSVVGLSSSANVGLSSTPVCTVDMNGQTVQQQVFVSGSLASQGITNVGFTSSPTSTQLRFTVLKTSPKFGALFSGATPVMLAVGSSQTWAKHLDWLAVTMDLTVATYTLSPAVPGATNKPTVPAPTVAPTVAATVPVTTQGSFAASVALGSQLLSVSVTPASGQVVVTYSSNAWIALALGSQMIGSTALIAMDSAQNPGYPTIGVYSMNGKDSSSQTVLSTRSLASFGISQASFSTQGGQSVLRFQMQNANSSVFGFLFETSASPVMFAAGRSQVFAKHLYYTQQTLQFVDAASNVVVAQAPVRFSAALLAHILMALLGFSVMMPAGASVALLRATGSKAWFKRHRNMQMLGAALGVLCLVPAAVNVNERELQHFSKTHHILGLALIAAVFQQVFNGLLRPHAPAQGHAPTMTRRGWFWWHRSCAFFALFGGGSNCLLGNNLLSDFAAGASQVQLTPGAAPSSLLSLQIAVEVLSILAIGFVGLALLWRIYTTQRVPAKPAGVSAAISAARSSPPLVKYYSDDKPNVVTLV